MTKNSNIGDMIQMRDNTRIQILRACNRLLREVPFEKITVSMIANKSGISKPTFYRYFKDKYDVMNYNYKRNLDKWVSNNNCSSWLEFYIKMYTASKADSEREKNAFSVSGTNSYKSFLFKYSYAAIESSATKCRGGAPLTREEKIHLSIFCYGVIDLNFDWINGNLDYTVEEIAKLTYLALPETLRDLWWSPEKPDYPLSSLQLNNNLSLC